MASSPISLQLLEFLTKYFDFYRNSHYAREEIIYANVNIEPSAGTEKKLESMKNKASQLKLQNSPNRIQISSELMRSIEAVNRQQFESSSKVNTASYSDRDSNESSNSWDDYYQKIITDVSESQRLR